jgi:predicted RNase H-like HicB family nuclease
VFTVEFDREDDGRWIAEIPELPGVMVYGESKDDALVKVQALAYRVVADRIEQEKEPQPEVRFAVA